MMRAVREFGTPLVDDPARLAGVHRLEVLADGTVVHNRQRR